MADQEEDFSALPLADRFSHKVWKVRKEAYEEATKSFETTADEYAPAFRPFLQDSGLLKGAVADSNVAAQQEGIACLCAFLKFGGREQCRATRSNCVTPIVEKGLSSTRATVKTSSVEALLLFIELDVSGPVIEDILPVLSSKQPKVVAAALAALTTIFHAYGCKTADPKPVLKVLPKAFGHADKNVRAEATNLAVEFYRWLREAMKPMFWNDLKPTQQTDLEAQFEKVKADGAPKQERLLRSQQAAKARAPVAGAGDEEDVGDYEEEPVEVDAFDLAEPQDVANQIAANFYDNLASSKWKERKEALEAAYALMNVPRIKDGDFNEMNRVLAKCMKDANIAVVTQAAQCIEVLAKGLRKAYAKHRQTIMQPILERLKEKKASVQDALGAALDQVFVASGFTDCLEDIRTFLVHKNPQVKEGTMHFLVRCLRTTRDVPSKAEIGQVVESAKKLLSEGSEGLRSGGAEVLGTVMKIIGERAMNPHLEGLDDIRKAKIKEFFETAEVKAKEKPKPKPPPPAAVSRAPTGGPKKVVGGAKKAAGVKKPVGLATPSKPSAPPILDDTPVAAPPATRPAASKLGLAKPSGLGGLKPPQKRTLTAPAGASPRRAVAAAPQFDDEEEEEPAAIPQARLGMGRGGLAARSLTKPALTPMTAPAPVSPPHVSGLTALERAELEELRSTNDRLLRQVDDARHNKTKLITEIQELKNQNAGLIEDHTRDVLSIKAKETQLVRARSDAEAAEQTNERLRRELDRLKKALNRAEAAAALDHGGAGDLGSPISSGAMSPLHDDAGIYRDGGPGSLTPARESGGFRPTSAIRNRVSYQSAHSEEKENGDQPHRTKYASGLSYHNGVSAATSNGMESPSRVPYRRAADSTASTLPPSYESATSPTISQASIGGQTNGEDAQPPGESWKRAAVVTSQLKARIEQMKAKQNLARR